MTSRFTTLVAACALAIAMSGSPALAHHPEQTGMPLSSPLGESTWFIGSFATAQNPFNPANRHVTSSDIAFWGDLAYVGDYGGFRIFDISESTPRLVSDVRCYGPQGDPSVFDGDGDGDADTLVLSVDSVLAGPQCGAGPVGKSSTTGRYPDGAWEGLRIFDVSDPAAPRQIATVYQDCGSHTNTLLPAPGGASMYVLNSSYPLGEGPTCGPLGAEQGRRVNHGVVQVVEVPFADPAAAAEVAELPVVYPGDADGTYRPVSEHGLVAPLDDFLGCHDLSAFPAKGIDRRRLRRAGPGLGHRPADRSARHGQPALGPRPAQRRLLALGDVQLGRQGRELHRRVVRRRLPDGDDEDRRPARRPAGVRDGEHVLLRGGQRRAAVGVPQPAPDERRHRARPPRQYCSSHLGIPVPAKDRYLLVNAYYRGGSSVIDFSDPTAPREIAYADLEGTNTWSAYTYPRHSGRRQHDPGVLQRRPEPQLRNERQPELPGGRVRLPAVPGGRRPDDAHRASIA